MRLSLVLFVSWTSKAVADADDPDAICKESLSVTGVANVPGDQFKSISDGVTLIGIDPVSGTIVPHLDCKLSRWRNSTVDADNSAIILVANELRQTSLNGAQVHFTGSDGVRHFSDKFSLPTDGYRIILFVGPADAFHQTMSTFGEPFIGGPFKSNECDTLPTEQISSLFSKLGDGTLYDRLEIEKLLAEPNFYVLAVHEANLESEFKKVISNSGAIDNWNISSLPFTATSTSDQNSQTEIDGTLFCR